MIVFFSLAWIILFKEKTTTFFYYFKCVAQNVTSGSSITKYTTILETESNSDKDLSVTSVPQRCRPWSLVDQQKRIFFSVISEALHNLRRLPWIAEGIGSSRNQLFSDKVVLFCFIKTSCCHVKFSRCGFIYLFIFFSFLLNDLIQMESKNCW